MTANQSFYFFQPRSFDYGEYTFAQDLYRSAFMCGIVAYIGRKVAQPLLIEGLKRLEYRGYDSAGIAVIDKNNKMHMRRAVCRISVLENSLSHGEPLPSAHIGMAHTRWATHG